MSEASNGRENGNENRLFVFVIAAVAALSGVLSVVFGLVLAVLPGVGLLSLVWLVGVCAFVFGVALIVLAFRMRGFRRRARGRVA